MSEAAILKGILLALSRDCGAICTVWRSNTGSLKDHTGRMVTFGVPGQADISGLLHGSGRRLEIEVKTATGRLRPSQETFRRVIEMAGGIYILARSASDAVAAVRAAAQSKE
jgi:hypothetical protein